MKTIVPLAWRILRSGGKNSLLSSGLTFLATATVTGLLLFAIAANFAFTDRAERTEWRSPDAVSESSATAVVSQHRDYVDEKYIVRVDMAALDSQAAPVPPGMDHFPEPGEIALSPAAKKLFDSTPDSELADRYSAEKVTELGSDALVHPDEAVIVVGHADESAIPDGTFLSPEANAPVAIDSFATGNVAESYGLYRVLMALATVLMVVPLVIFGAATARLSVARRETRLASMRLMGATPAQVAGLTLAENMITALMGAVSGAALWLLVTPLVARIPIDGGPWFVSDLWMSLPYLAATVALVPVLVGIAAIVGLRRIVISPLGVSRRTTAPALKSVRLVMFAGAIVAFIVAANVLPASGMIVAVTLLGLMAGVLLAFNWLGPWVVQLIGKIFAATATGPAQLLAARRLIADPKEAWRTVAGVALTGFAAGFLALLPVNDVDDATGTERDLTVYAESGEYSDLASTMDDGIPAARDLQADSDTEFDFVTFTVDNNDYDQARTEATQLAPDASVTGSYDWVIDNNVYGSSIRTGSIVVLGVSFIAAIVSAAIAGMSSVLARRDVYHLMHLSGTPMRVLNRARRQETLIPLTVMGLGSIGSGMLLASPFAVGFSFDTDGILILLVTLIIGFGGVIAANATSRPLLRAAVSSPTIRPD